MITRDRAVALVRRLEAAVNAHDASQLAVCYADDAVAISPVFGEVRGREAIVETWLSLFSTLPDSVFDLGDVFTDGERVMFLGAVTATDSRGWFGLPATGARITYKVSILLTMADDLIVRDERLYDSSGVVERLEKARIDSEIATAAEVQHTLLPRTSKTGAHWEAAGDSIACRAIGGDFFAFVEVPGDALAFALADVEGKGTPAALVAATLHGMFLADAQSTLAPEAILARMNRQLVSPSPPTSGLATRQRGSRFATAFCGVLAADGRLAYANAGHQAPVLFSGAGIRRLRTGGPVLGAFAAPSFTAETLHLASGDTLIAWSDGVVEACDESEEELGEERLLARALASRGKPALEQVDGILGDVRAFCGQQPQSDDVTTTVLRYL